MSVFITAKNSKSSINQFTNYKYGVKPCGQSIHPNSTQYLRLCSYRNIINTSDIEPSFYEVVLNSNMPAGTGAAGGMRWS